jgi:hypothetical protein
MRKNLFRTAALAMAILTAGVSSGGENDVLYWMVDDSAQVTKDGTTQSIGDFFSDYMSSSENWSATASSFAARIRVTGGDISGDVFLGLYGRDEYNVPYIESGELGMAFDSSGTGYWGAGVPDGNQSPSGNYSAGDPEYSFIVEIGNVVWDENSGTASWVETVATSAAAAYSSLGAYIHQTFDMNPGQMAVWTQTSFNAVPEPSSGLLTVIGFAFLALRRQRKGA